MSLQERRRRSPHGERGLKFDEAAQHVGTAWSLPSRGAWIEIFAERVLSDSMSGRSPHGERGLKFMLYAHPGVSNGVAPLTGSVD